VGLYAQHVFPRLMEWTLGAEVPARERARVLRDVRGDVLEIGFGTGLNLPHYPPAVTRLTIIDDADVLRARVDARIAAVPFPVERAQLTAERLPFATGRFDFVVSTWTLCTIPDVVAALRESRRVLRPDGRLIFLEHGRSDDPRVARWQDRLNPIQNVIACGCHLNRAIDTLVRAAGLEITELERYVLPGMPRAFAEMYRGSARASAAA
jgi:SAM-dependent methyltransferase